MPRESIGNRRGIGGESMGRVGELRRGSYRGEFATFVAGEFARYASRRYRITVVPECSNRGSSVFELRLLQALQNLTPKPLDSRLAASGRDDEMNLNFCVYYQDLRIVVPECLNRGSSVFELTLLQALQTSTPSRWTPV